ncbi:MAG: amidohydrolase [Micrococcales bacterium]|nr:amidohydrolase [Micrococcales bacterium]
MTTIANARVGDTIVDVAISDGRIALISPSGSTPAAGERLDIGGRWLLPGLWDHHVHANQQALAVRRVDLSAAASAAEAARTMTDHLSRIRLTEGQPIIGHGFRDGLWPDVPTLDLLDAAVPGVPAVLISGDLHCCWLNTPALALYGYTGHPTGVLLEDDCFEVVGRLGQVPDETLDEWVAEAASAAATRGVVGVVDYEMTDNLASWRRRFAAGFDALRIQAGIYTEHLDAAVAAGHSTGEVIEGSGGLLTVGQFKILTDGSLNTRTAYCIENYPGTRERGLLTVPTEQLVPLLRTAWGAGIHPAVHAIGDEANRLALDAFELVGCHGRIEHAQLVRDEDFLRFAALGVAASVQPEHAMDDRDIAERYWAGRTDRSFAFRSLIDAGAQLLLGSDAPVSPLDPWVTISAAVTRARGGRKPWHPEQTITVGEALVASAHSGVDVGQVADLIAVDRDPSTATGDELRTMPVALTLLAGRPTHQAL